MKLPNKMVPKIIVHDAWCKGCGICVAFCQRKVLLLNGEKSKVSVAQGENCTACRICEFKCPDFAIEVFAGGN